MRILKTYFSLLTFSLFITACGGESTKTTEETSEENVTTEVPSGVVQIEAESFQEASSALEKGNTVSLSADTWLAYTVDIPATGRYRVTAMGIGSEGSALWIEDYVGNKDDRTYDITGKMRFSSTDIKEVSIDGTPLQAGSHSIRVHAVGGEVNLDWVRFEPMMLHRETKEVLVQNMDGQEWELVWSDEFDQAGMPDTNKWSYNVGNWGWGNNELQYYTNADSKNARVENGNLVIEAHKDAEGDGWSSARLTTQGKTAFKYGKIEFRAKVPTGRGTWSALAESSTCCLN